MTHANEKMGWGGAQALHALFRAPPCAICQGRGQYTRPHPPSPDVSSLEVLARPLSRAKVWAGHINSPRREIPIDGQAPAAHCERGCQRRHPRGGRGGRGCPGSPSLPPPLQLQGELHPSKSSLIKTNPTCDSRSRHPHRASSPVYVLALSQPPSPPPPPTPPSSPQPMRWAVLWLLAFTAMAQAQLATLDTTVHEVTVVVASRWRVCVCVCVCVSF